MQSIGERLEEARKKRGISLREAAEATKIRNEHLQNFENNHFDIGLPQVYVRGFLRQYCKLLKLEPEQILADYQAFQLGKNPEAEQETREFYGRMELQSRAPAGESHHIEAEPQATQETPRGTLNLDTGPVQDDIEENTLTQQDGNLYWKIGGIFAGTFVFVLIAAFTFNFFFGSKNNEINHELAAAPAQSTSSQAMRADEEITLVALDDVQVAVRQEADKARIYSGVLSKGQRISLKKKGQVKIFFNEGKNLLVEKNGKQYSMNTEGVAIRVFN